MSLRSQRENPTVKIPSKTFLSGEYAVLDGYKALVLTHEPYFKCSIQSESSNESELMSFHKDSPAGKLEIELSGVQRKWTFEDPHFGVGGFGGSTAEFIGVYKSLSPDGDLQDLCKKYFALFKDKKRPPSGADLVAQFSGQQQCLIYTKTALKAQVCDWPFKEVGLLILKTDVKLPTHKHLDSLADVDFSKLGACSHAALEAFTSRSLPDFVNAVDQFSLEQFSQGLLLEQSKKAAERISKLNDVYTARGCGAMGADVIVVFVKKESMDYVWKQIRELDEGLKRVT